VNAAVTVVGPNAFQQQITGTTTLVKLAPGSYTVTAASVTSGATTYSPTPSTQNVSVTAGATRAATVAYSAPGVVTATASRDRALRVGVLEHPSTRRRMGARW